MFRQHQLNQHVYRKGQFCDVTQKMGHVLFLLCSYIQAQHCLSEKKKRLSCFIIMRIFPCNHKPITEHDNNRNRSSQLFYQLKPDFVKIRSQKVVMIFFQWDDRIKIGSCLTLFIRLSIFLWSNLLLTPFGISYPYYYIGHY